MAKYRFKKDFEDAKISIAILNKVISKETLTDEDVETLSEKFPGKFDHNFETIDSEPKKVEAVEKVGKRSESVRDESPKAKRKPSTKKAD